ncbi:MAG: histidine kinase [Bacillaceae bacterium]|nr:histidine kinase [Bacillaceae bacterium]
MLSYEAFFIIIMVSVLGPLIGLLILIFYNLMEKEVYLLEMENRRIYLEKELDKSEYIQLTQQIHPHFLFNTLNSLLSLARLRKTDQLINSFEHLVLYFRYKYQPKKQLHPLNEEIEHTRHYLAIQQMRYGSRFEITWEIDPVLTRAVAPPYLLQTLVENVFKHAIEEMEDKILIQIRLQQVTKENQSFVELRVKDNGPGFQHNPLKQENDSGGEGIGLFNINKRLKLLFHDQVSIDIPTGRHQNGGLVVVTWPLVFQDFSDPKRVLKEGDPL